MADIGDAPPGEVSWEERMLNSFPDREVHPLILEIIQAVRLTIPVQEKEIKKLTDEMNGAKGEIDKLASENLMLKQDMEEIKTTIKLLKEEMAKAKSETQTLNQKLEQNTENMKKETQSLIGIAEKNIMDNANEKYQKKIFGRDINWKVVEAHTETGQKIDRNVLHSAVGVFCNAVNCSGDGDQAGRQEFRIPLYGYGGEVISCLHIPRD